MIGRICVLSLLIVLLYGLTEEEIKAFTPKDIDFVEQNTGKKSQVWVKDNNDGTLTVITNSIPNHNTWIFPRGDGNPHELKEIWANFTINKEPIMRKAGEEIMCLPHGNIGVATSGVAIDSWFASEKGCPTAEEFEELDICEGHPSPSNQYHYHHYSPCAQMPVCGQPSPIYGVAVDGIPIYGPYDEEGKQLTNQDLDKCGGKYDNKGRYKYHVTVDPPYYLGCFKGEIRADVNSGGDNQGWFCSCPFDDSMMREKKAPPSKGGPDGGGGAGGGGPDRPVMIMMCNFNNPDKFGSAQCNDDTYNTSYKINVKWTKKKRTVKLAPCCPKGKDCGKSCKTEAGVKAVCVQEERVIDYKTRLYLNGTEVPSNWKISGNEKGEIWSKRLFVLLLLGMIYVQKL